MRPPALTSPAAIGSIRSRTSSQNMSLSRRAPLLPPGFHCGPGPSGPQTFFTARAFVLARAAGALPFGLKESTKLLFGPVQSGLYGAQRKLKRFGEILVLNAF